METRAGHPRGTVYRACGSALGQVLSDTGTAKFVAERRGGSETRPAGNAVSLDDEMMKVAQNQMDYQAATSLYTRSLGLLKTAIGKR